MLVQEGDEALGQQLLLDAVVGGHFPAQGVTQLLVACRRTAQGFERVDEAFDLLLCGVHGVQTLNRKCSTSPSWTT